MSRPTAKLSAAALITLGSLVALPALAQAPTTAASEAPKAPAAAPAPAATAPAPAAPAPAQPAPAPAAPAAPAAPPAAAPAPAPAPGKAAAQPPEEVDLPERPVLSYEGSGAWEEAEDKLGTAFEQLAIAANKVGVKPDGAPMVQYVESDESGFSFVVMLPIDKAPAKGKPLPKGIKSEVSLSGPALRFSPSAAGDDLEEVYARIDDYLTQKGLALSTMVEEYGDDAIASPEDRVVVDIYVFTE